MGMGKHHWRPPLLLEDFEFENERLVKIRGMRPAYMDGYTLIAALEYLVELYLAEKAGKYDVDISALIKAAGAMAYDYQTSEKHHPDHVLVPRSEFEAMCLALKKPIKLDLTVEDAVLETFYPLPENADPGGPEAPDSGGTTHD